MADGRRRGAHPARHERQRRLRRARRRPADDRADGPAGGVARRRGRGPSRLPGPRRVRAAGPRHGAGRARGVDRLPGRGGRRRSRPTRACRCGTSSRTARCTTRRRGILRWRRSSRGRFARVSPSLVLVGLAGSALIAAGRAAGLPDGRGGVRRPGVRGRRLAAVATPRRCGPRGPIRSWPRRRCRSSATGGSRPRRLRRSPSAPTRSASTATAPAPRRSRGRSGRRWRPRPAVTVAALEAVSRGRASGSSRWASRRCSSTFGDAHRSGRSAARARAIAAAIERRMAGCRAARPGLRERARPVRPAVAVRRRRRRTSSTGSWLRSRPRLAPRATRGRSPRRDPRPLRRRRRARPRRGRRGSTTCDRPTSSRSTRASSTRRSSSGSRPGFAYLGPLPASIATPRLDVPRPRVPAGSVAIAGAQTRRLPDRDARRLAADRPDRRSRLGPDPRARRR